MTVREHIAYMLNKRINIDKIITQTEIAKKYNCSQPTISKIRIGAVNKIRRILLSKL